MRIDELFHKAKELAIQKVNENAILESKDHNRLSKLPDDQAIQWVAREFLERATNELRD